MSKENQSTILILGGDGYLGWSLGLAFANRTDNYVVLADNLIKRKWEKDVNAKLLAPIKKPNERIAEYKRLFGKNNMSFEKLDLLDQKAITKILRKYRPAVVINAAQQPSAPFSMKSPENAAITFNNNLIGHLNVLWSIAQVDKSITCIKLGSAGCYMDVDTDFLPLGKKDLHFSHNGKNRKILNSFIPMRATDFYHQSKISDFLLDDLCSSLWNLKVITVQQATIFGATIAENHPASHSALAARFNYDAVFSTVLNRFACQIAIGHPMTIYGDGKQRTGLISLEDSVENFIRLSKLNIKPGKHMVVHNYTQRLSIEEIAQKLVEIEPSAKIKYIKNPRDEGSGKLTKEVQIHSAIRPQHKAKEDKLRQELSNLIDFAKRHHGNIDQSIILPKVQWVVEEEIKRRRLLRKTFAAVPSPVKLRAKILGETT